MFPVQYTPIKDLKRSRQSKTIVRIVQVNGQLYKITEKRGK